MRVVFVHGAFVRDGAWWWAPVAELLAADGIASESVALPSCGESAAVLSATGPGLYEDAAALTKLIDDGDETVVVASSYGGTVAAQAGDSSNVRRLVYISSFLPDIGDTHAEVVSSQRDPVLVAQRPDGSLAIVADDRAAFDARFVHDVGDQALTRGAYERLVPQSPAALTTPTTAAAWHDIESTYLVCAQDRNTPPDLQRIHAARATQVVELPSGHHPFLSHPALVAEQVRIACAQR